MYVWVCMYVYIFDKSLTPCEQKMSQRSRYNIALYSGLILARIYTHKWRVNMVSETSGSLFNDAAMDWICIPDGDKKCI